MKELLEVIARNLVDNPDAVTVSEVKGERSIILELKVAPGTWARLLESRAELPRLSELLLRPQLSMRIRELWLK